MQISVIFSKYKDFFHTLIWYLYLYSWNNEIIFIVVVYKNSVLI
jgi:hypothetical protein